jgi:hypothetical protein
MADGKVWVVYSVFPDDPSTVHGIFTDEQAAIKFCIENVHTNKMDTMEFDLNVPDIDGVVLG